MKALLVAILSFGLFAGVTKACDTPVQVVRTVRTVEVEDPVVLVERQVFVPIVRVQREIVRQEVVNIVKVQRVNEVKEVKVVKVVKVKGKGKRG